MVARSHLLVAALTLALISSRPDPDPSPTTGPALQGAVEGTVVLETGGAERSVPSRYRRRPAAREGSASEDAGALEHTVVYLEPVEGQAPRTSGGSSPTLGQRDQTFIPHVLPVQTGTTVRITNQDGIYHNVFSLSPPQKFDIGRRPTGEEVPVRFDEPGIVRVFCDIHATMSAFVVVLDTPWFTTADQQGTFRLEDMPPGRYWLRAWHPGGTSEPAEIRVEEGRTLSVEIVVR